MSCMYDKHNYENDKTPKQKKLKSIKILSNIGDETTEFVKAANVQSKQKLTFEKLVNNSPPKIKPYLKLIRLDRPIGKKEVS